MTKKEIRMQVALGTIILAQLSQEEFAYWVHLKYNIKDEAVSKTVANNLPLLREAMINTGSWS